MPGFIEKYCCRRYRLAAHALQTRTIPSALASDRLNHVFGKKKSAPPPPFHTRTPLGAGPTSSQASMTTFCERDHVYFDRILEFNLVRHPKVCIISILFLDLNKKGRKKKIHLLSLTLGTELPGMQSFRRLNDFKRMCSLSELRSPPAALTVPLKAPEQPPPSTYLHPDVGPHAFANKPGPAPSHSRVVGRNCKPQPTVSP